MMLDTTIEMIEKQREILFSKSPTERSVIGDETIAFGRTIVESSIKYAKPSISEIDLKIAVFKRYYKDCFNKNELEKIINSMKYYYSHPD